MKRCDLVIATGGRPMVKSAYSSGVPAYGSGAGNATVIIDDTCNTPEYQKEAAENTRISKCSDFGSGCSCDGNLIISAEIYDDFVKALVNEGAYLANEEEAEKLKNVMWDETGHRLPNTVAISPRSWPRPPASPSPTTASSSPSPAAAWRAWARSTSSPARS